VNRRLALDQPPAKEPTTTTDTAQRNPIAAGRLILTAGIFLIIILLAAYAIRSGDDRFAATGDSFPGMPTNIGEIFVVPTESANLPPDGWDRYTPPTLAELFGDQ